MYSFTSAVVMIRLYQFVFVSMFLNDLPCFPLQEKQVQDSAISELQKRLEISVSLSSSGFQIVDELEDREFMELASELVGNRASSNRQVLQNHSSLLYFIASCFVRLH